MTRWHFFMEYILLKVHLSVLITWHTFGTSHTSQNNNF